METGKDSSCQFYHLASDDDPFRVQSYRSPSLLECKHMIKEVIDTSDWLKCGVCKQWFHENCF